MTQPPRVILLLLLGLLLAPALASAQVSASDKAAAEALFDYGLQLMRKGDYAQACVKLEQSQAIDGGIGTMLYLAECYERAGRTASAWALFRQAASEAAAGGQHARAEQGRQRAERLEAQLSKLTVNVAPPAAAGMVVLLDDAPLGSGVWGVPLPVDPGEHKLVARANGHATWTGSVKVGAHSDASAEIPALVAAPESATPVDATTAQPTAAAVAVASTGAIDGEPSTQTSTAPPAPDDERGDVQRVIGLVVGAVGVVGVGVGTYFGVTAISKNSDAEKFCPGGGAVCNDARGESLTDDAQSAAALSNGFVIGGAALAVTGLLVYLLAPSGDESSDGAASVARSFALGSDGRSVELSWGGAL